MEKEKCYRRWRRGNIEWFIKFGYIISKIGGELLFRVGIGRGVY